MVSLKKLSNELILHYLRCRSISNDTRDFVISGIPRSGTSLLCAVISLSPEALCFNELQYNVRYLPVFFYQQRRRIKTGGRIANKVDAAGRYITSTNDSNKNTITTVDPEVGPERFALASKVTVPYLNRLPTIMNHGYRIVVMVRDPTFAIGSWNTKKLEDTPMNKVWEPVHAHWKNVSFSSEHKYERQAEIWEHFASIIWRHREKVYIIRYEDLASAPYETLSMLCGYLGVASPSPKHMMEMGIENKNDDTYYPRINRIREAVERHAPIRKNFGYE